VTGCAIAENDLPRNAGVALRRVFGAIRRDAMKAIQYRAYGGYQENRDVDVDQMSSALKVVQPTTKFADSLSNSLMQCIYYSYKGFELRLLLRLHSGALCSAVECLTRDYSR
jgi:hypothetical protein